MTPRTTMMKTWTFCALAGIVSIGQAATDCSSGAFSYPDLFGADFTSLTAEAVHSFKYANTSTPEGKLVRPAGIDLCNVTLQYNHPGQNDTTKVQVWLPLNGWNGKFVGLGGGGFAAGNLDGESLTATVSLGYSGKDHTSGKE